VPVLAAAPSCAFLLRLACGVLNALLGLSVAAGVQPSGLQVSINSHWQRRSRGLGSTGALPRCVIASRTHVLARIEEVCERARL